MDAKGETRGSATNSGPVPRRKRSHIRGVLDEWAKLAAEEPDARGVEWLEYSDRAGARAMPLPRSPAHLKREITEEE